MSDNRPMNSDAEQPLVMYTIYNNPEDFPGLFVCRRWFLFKDGAGPRAEIAPFAVSEDLEGLRQELPPRLHCLARNDGDDPVIVETWL